MLRGQTSTDYTGMIMLAPAFPYTLSTSLTLDFIHLSLPKTLLFARLVTGK